MFRWAAGAILFVFGAHTIVRNEVYKDSLTFWRTRTLELPNHELAFYNYGRTLMELGANEEAATSLARAVAINPRFMDGYEQANLALCLTRSGRIDEAKRVIAEGLALFPSNPSLVAQSADLEASAVPEGLRALYDRAMQADSAGDCNAALALLRQLHEHVANLKISRFAAGWCLQRQGKLKEAVIEYRAGMDAAPSQLQSYVNAGYAYLELGQPRDACEAFAGALKRKPDDTNSAWGLGECKRRMARP